MSYKPPLKHCHRESINKHYHTVNKFIEAERMNGIGLPRSREAALSMSDKREYEAANDRRNGVVPPPDYADWIRSQPEYKKLIRSRKGRQVLTMDDAIAVRCLYAGGGWLAEELALVFNVAGSTIRSIITNRIWKE